MKNTMIISIVTWLSIALFSCKPEPRPIDYGGDNCHFCKMTVVDAQYAAQAVTSKGKVFVFDAIECMIHYIDQNDLTNWAHLMVNDYSKPKDLIRASEGHFLISEAMPSPMGAFLTAFSDVEIATSMKDEKGGVLYDWAGVRSFLTNEY